MSTKRKRTTRANARSMDRVAAVRHLHERHPRIIHEAGETVSPGDLHLEVFWLQGYIQDAISDRSERSLKRYFKTMDRLLAEGNREVMIAVFESFLRHVVFHPAIQWAKTLMPPRLADALCAVEADLRKSAGRQAKG